MKTSSVVLALESVKERLWSDHSNKTSSICFCIFYKMKLGICLEF